MYLNLLQWLLLSCICWNKKTEAYLGHHQTSMMNFFSEISLTLLLIFRSSHSEVFLWKGVLQLCSKLTGEHQCRSVISIKLQSNFVEIKIRHGCSPVNLLHIFWPAFSRNTSECLLLYFSKKSHHRCLRRSWKHLWKIGAA